MLTKAPIKQFAKVGSGQGAPQRETDFSETGIPFVRAGSLEDLLNGMDEYELPKVNEEIAKEYRLKVYQPNTIVFAKSGMSALKGRIYKLKNPCYVVNHLATLELKENAIPDYVIYTLRHFSPVKLINDNAYPSLKQSVIENYEIPFPKDKDVQLHIANILSKAENLIAQRKESIRLLDEFLKSTFLEMFGDPFRNEKGWEINSLSRFGSLKNGLNYTRSELGVNVRCLGVGDFKDYSKLTDIESLQVLNLTSEPNNEYYLNDGDLVFVRSNGNRELVGRCLLVYPRNEKVTFSGFCIRYRIENKGLNPIFVSHLFRVPIFRTVMLQGGKGANIQNISQQTLEKLKIPTPPIELQTQFAQIVEKTEALKSQYQQSLQELENLYGSLSQKAFRGELAKK